MKIGIIGLKPRQVADLNTRTFQHEVICMANADKRFTSTSAAAFARDKDLVLILQQQVPKHILEGIPAKKRHTMAGSVSTVINYINNLDKPQPAPGPQLMHWSEHETVKDDLPDMIRAGTPLEDLNEALAFFGVRTLQLDEFKRLRKQGNQLVLSVGKPPKTKTPPVETTPAPVEEKKILTEAEQAEVQEEQSMAPPRFDPKINAKEVAEILVEHKVDHLFDPPKDSMLPTRDMVAFPLPVSLYSDVPDGHRSQYLLPKHEILVNYPNSGGVMDYTILKAALPGDVLRFARPEGVSMRVWRGRITAMRWNYFRNHKLLIEAHFYQDYVDLKIMEKLEDIVHQENFSMAPDAEAQANEYREELNTLSDKGREMEKEIAERVTLGRTQVNFLPGEGVNCYYFIPHLQPVRDYLDYLQGVLDGTRPAIEYNTHVNIDTTIHDGPDQSPMANREQMVREMLDKKPPVGLKGFNTLRDELGLSARAPMPTRAATAEEQAFWRQVHLALLGQGQSVADASTGADEALQSHTARFS